MQKLHEYQGFGVNISEITQILGLLEKNGISLLEESGFNYSKIRGIKEYLNDFGLTVEGMNLSELGRVIKRNDKKLTEDFSKWICVYHWSAKANNPVLFYLINEYSGGVKRIGLSELFKEWAKRNNVQTEYKKNFASGLVSKTITALTEPDAFHTLNLFTLHEDQLYRAEPYNVHPLLLAYILYDNRNNRVSTSVNELMQEPGNIAKFFGYDSQTLDKQLKVLQGLGYINRVQTADLYMINYSFSDSPLSLVEKYYNENL